VNNYARGRGATWAANYYHDSADYGDSFYEYRQASIELGFWANRTTRFFAAGGMESPWDDPLDHALRDSFWEVGFSRTLSRRLQAELGAGERSFGPSFRGRLDVDLGHGHSNLSYSETPTTNSFDRFSKGALTPDDPEDFLFRAGTIERYIKKRLEWQLRSAHSRTELVTTLYDESREERTQIDGTPLPDEFTTGGEVEITWKMGARTELVISGMVADSEFADGNASDVTVASLGWNYRLGARTELKFQYQYIDVKYTPHTDYGYTHNMVTASVVRTFGTPTL
jgi:hypothetical protein